MILLIQLVFSTSLAAALRWGATDTLTRIFPPQSTQSVALLAFTPVGLPLIALVKDKHPWNLLATFVWSVVFATFIAASDLPDAFVKCAAGGTAQLKPYARPHSTPSGGNGCAEITPSSRSSSR